MRATRLALALALAGILARDAGAQLPVFAGDPVDPSTGAAYMVLPGVPLIYPGERGRFNRGIDVVNPAIVGDVDLVIRTGGGYAGGPIPAPHAGVAVAPGVTVGGTATAAGNEVTFQGILSDGQPPRATGNPVTSAEMNGHPVLAVGYGDLDGDGVIGPTDADGGADDEIERQEMLVPVGRHSASIVNGVATGALAFYVGAPASAGGLGVVVGAGATTGTTPFLYFDGPWIATLLPYMLPLDPDRIIGSNRIGGPEPFRLLADFEMEIEEAFSPPPDHPVLGTPFAIPLDGTSPTVDLVRSESGAAASVAFGRPVDAATFVAGPTQQLHPGVGAGGERALFADVDAIPLASDGAGGAATVQCYVTDRLGNATDPPPGGYAITLEAGPRLRIVSPDVDGNPRVEPLTFAAAAAANVVIDDAGTASTTPVVDRMVVTRAGVPIAALRIDLAAGPGGPGGGGPTALGKSRVRIRRATGGRGVLAVTALFGVGTRFDPSVAAITLTVATPAATVYTRTFAAGSLRPNRARTIHRFSDPKSAGPGRVSLVSVRWSTRAATTTLRLKIPDADVSAAPATGTLTATVQVGTSAFAGDLTCGRKARGAVTSCVRPTSTQR